MYFSSLITLKLEEHRDLSGTIFFGEDHPSPSIWHSEDKSEFYEPEFFRIADSKKAYTILYNAIQRQRNRRANPVRESGPVSRSC